MEESGPRADRAVALDDLAKLGGDFELNLRAVTRKSVWGRHVSVTMLRRTLSSMHPVDAMEQLTKQLGRFKTNFEFIKLISSARMD